MMVDMMDEIMGSRYLVSCSQMGTSSIEYTNNNVIIFR